MHHRSSTTTISFSAVLNSLKPRAATDQQEVSVPAGTRQPPTAGSSSFHVTELTPPTIPRHWQCHCNTSSLLLFLKREWCQKYACDKLHTSTKSASPWEIPLRKKSKTEPTERSYQTEPAAAECRYSQAGQQHTQLVSEPSAATRAEQISLKPDSDFRAPQLLLTALCSVTRLCLHFGMMLLHFFSYLLLQALARISEPTYQFSEPERSL